MKSIVVEDRQSIYDIAIQEYGGVEGVFSLLKDNPGLTDGLNTRLTAGAKLKVKSPAVNVQVLNYYTENGIKPATITEVQELGLDFLMSEDLKPLLTETQRPIGIEQSSLQTEGGNDITTEDEQQITN